ncbi:MAG: UDP-2,4-diacetamido-2,4,6-trideoxy-beta-L-altropyranose hydrolase [Bacteroidia bacterium]|nr:UDP-2,4-diacetamido-2,4,6-trideoxy-beta-L-altropyranose hydrolase [Bacteroidia bacterium]
MNNKQHTKILIRVDGSSEIGLGHIVRCLSLAYILKNNFSISFYCQKIPLHLASDIKANDFGLNMIENENSFFEVISSCDIVVIDGYNFDKKYQINIKNKKCKLVCVDDLFDKHYYADLIINHTPGILPSHYMSTPYTQFALGLNYALLRPSFLDQANQSRIIESIKTILICFGGSDPKNLTLSILNIVREFSEFNKIVVVMGSAFVDKKSVLDLTYLDSRIESHFNANEKQMLDLMITSDLLIVPSSSVLIEAIYCGCIPISGFYTDNQKYIYQKFLEQQLFFDAGSFEKENVISAIKQVINKIKEPFQKKINLSSHQLLKVFNQLSKSINTSVRKANSGALELTYAWASNEVIRANSFSQHQISKEEHTNWYLKKISESNCFYFIFNFFEESIGSIRFDNIEGRLKISYLLDPKCHGQGFGTIILYKGIEFLYNNNLLNNISEIYGEVFSNNIPSLMAFRRLGFSEQKLDKYYVFTKKISKICC